MATALLVIVSVLLFVALASAFVTSAAARAFANGEFVVVPTGTAGN